MPIGFHGLPFDKTVIAILENNLAQNGVELHDIDIDKQLKPANNNVPLPLDIEYTYTVSVADKSFSIVFLNDVQFAKFFFNLCTAPEDKGRHPIADMAESMVFRLNKFIAQAGQSTENIAHWLKQSAFSKD